MVSNGSMKNYNIYVNNKYLFTSLCDNESQAIHIAKREANLQECTEYNIVLTHSDTIPECDLIYDYVTNDNSGKITGTTR
jgi:hypothetical protein